VCPATFTDLQEKGQLNALTNGFLVSFNHSFNK